MMIRIKTWLVVVIGALSVGCPGLFPSVPTDYWVVLRAPMPAERMQTMRAEIEKSESLKPVIRHKGDDPSCWHHTVPVRSAVVESGVEAGIMGCRRSEEFSQETLVVSVYASARNDSTAQAEVERIADRIENVLQKHVAADKVDRESKWYPLPF